MIKLFCLLFFSLQTFAVEKCLEISEQQMQEWMAFQPKIPALAYILKAKKLVDAEKDYALSLGHDKTAHCYFGCRIRAEVNLETAKYIAWKKEQSDATDCNPETHFDLGDYDATLLGTQMPAQSCALSCQAAASQALL